MNQAMFESGSFIIGCNYWASHAGTHMWRRWDKAAVRHDFELLRRHRIRYVRIFPLWPDFQPLKMHYMVEGQEKELRLGEDPLPHTEAGQAGLDEVMLGRFRTLCDLAEAYGLKLIVGLITGWMSGRLYVPEPFLTVNVLTDARAIKWQVKMVRHMVKTFRDHPAIVAWDLGNECNCLAPLSSADEAYLWASTITMAIKAEDTSRPVISGMHSTFPEAHFRPKDLGEILDVLCTHPYPLFTPHCMTDPIIEKKSALHAVAETVLYRGLSGKPAFVEEIGTLGPMIASEEHAAAYIHTVLHQLRAHDALGLLWWCGFDQSHLTHTPYDWNAVERELGLFRADDSPKPVAHALEQFARLTEQAPPLPPRIVDAVCVITAEADSWRAAYGTFLLAKGAGLDVEFCHIDDPLPEARAYLLPSLSHDHIATHTLRPILERVEQGAVLYVSLGEALLCPFREIFGLVPQYRYKKTAPDTVTLPGGEVLKLQTSFKIPFVETTAEVLLRDEEGVPVMAKNRYGKGTVYLLAYPVEDVAGSEPGVISGPSARPLHELYRLLTELRHPSRVLDVTAEADVTFTEHIGNGGERQLVLINCAARTAHARCRAQHGASFTEVVYTEGGEVRPTDDGIEVKLPPHTATVLGFCTKAL